MVGLQKQISVSSMCHVFYVSYFRFGSYVSCSSLLVCIYVVACFPSMPNCLCYPCVMVHSWVFVPPWLPYVTVSGTVDFSDLFFFLLPAPCCPPFSAAPPVCDLLPPPGSKRLFPGFWYLGFVLLLHLLLGPFTLCQLCGKSPAAAAAAKMSVKKRILRSK